MTTMPVGICPECAKAAGYEPLSCAGKVLGECRVCLEQKRVYMTEGLTMKKKSLFAENVVASVCVLLGTLCFLAVIVMANAGCSTTDKARIEKEIERVKDRIEGKDEPDAPVGPLPPKPSDDTPPPVEPPPAQPSASPWAGKDITVDRSTCDGSVDGWSETAQMVNVTVRGSVITWGYADGKAPTWKADSKLSDFQSNMMLIGRRGDRWDTWYGHWLRYNQKQQDFAQQFYERGRAWPTDYDEVWVCVAAPNRAGCRTTTERTNWVKVK